jgi:hypothetical protein
MLTEECLLLEMLYLLDTLAMWDDDTSSASIQRRRQADLIVLGHAYNNQGMALRMVLSGMDSVMKCEAVEHAMLNVYPDEVGFP